MNASNAAQFLPLVQALAEGKTIQYRNEHLGWIDKNEPNWTYGPTDWRIKPEPREFVIWTNGDEYTVPNRKGDKLQERSVNAGWVEIRTIEIL